MAKADTIKVHVLHCGSISVSPGVPRNENGKGGRLTGQILAPAKGRVELPVSAYLIEHPKGLILMDTGWSRRISPAGVYDPKAVRSLLPPHLAAFYRPSVAPGQTALEQLARMGVRPEDLDLVLLSHLDPDHTCALEDFRNARRLLLAEEERWWTVRTVYHIRQPMELWFPYRPEIFWYKGTPIGPSRWSYDLFDDESVTLVNLPGHTDGMFGMLIRNRDRFLILAADAAFSRRSWEELIVPGFGFNPVAQKKSLLWLREMAADKGCLGILASHDPDILPQVIEV